MLALRKYNTSRFIADSQSHKTHPIPQETKKVHPQQTEGKLISTITIIGFIFLMSINSLMWKPENPEPQQAMNGSSTVDY